MVYRLILDIKSLLVDTSIKRVPDLSHTRLIWYLIPVLILVSNLIMRLTLVTTYVSGCVTKKKGKIKRTNLIALKKSKHGQNL
jgi:hypothetical protein